MSVCFRDSISAASDQRPLLPNIFKVEGKLNDKVQFIAQLYIYRTIVSASYIIN
jgi:hypothetical protein